ncbi:MAG TPA: TetR/AcrR family transcriptional regulator [Brevundimonas sp.]
MAWAVVGRDGADALTLARLAAEAGVAKPVVYSHFPHRNDLLLALYQEFDEDQSLRLEAALREAEVTLPARAEALSRCYVDCFVSQTRRIPGVSAALDAAPDLSRHKAYCERRYGERFRAALAPFASHGTVSRATLRGILGAADGLSRGAAAGDISEDEARRELCRLIRSAIFSST